MVADDPASGAASRGFDLLAAYNKYEVRFLHDEDLGRWLVTLSDAGDPKSWTVEVDTGTGFISEPFLAEPPGFPALSYDSPHGVWSVADNACTVRVTLTDGQVLEVETR